MVQHQWLGWLPSIAYPVVDPKEGWWYPQTSTINWCEEVSLQNSLSHFLIFALEVVDQMCWGSFEKVL